MNCAHEERTQVWVEEEDWYSGQMVGRWTEKVVSLCEDISLHKYQCSRCRQVFYYSSNAREHYENGGELWWPDKAVNK